MCRGELKLRECIKDMEIIIDFLLGRLELKLRQLDYRHGNHHKTAVKLFSQEVLTKGDLEYPTDIKVIIK